MKKFIKKNKTISLFGFISICISVSYAVTYNMPDYFGIEGWYSLLNNISISYIAALIFYVLQIYKPMCENSDRALAILEPLFNDLSKFIEICIECCRKFISIDEEDKILIDWYNKEEKVLYFIPEIKGKKKETRPAIKKTKSELMMLEKEYKSKIREIKERIDFRECDPSIIKALSKLESTDFYKSVINVALNLEESFITIKDLEEKIVKFEELKDEFKRYCGISVRYTIRDPKTEEIAAIEAILNNNALQSKTESDFVRVLFQKDIELKFGQLFKDEKQRNELSDACLMFSIKK